LFIATRSVSSVAGRRRHRAILIPLIIRLRLRRGPDRGVGVAVGLRGLHRRAVRFTHMMTLGSGGCLNRRGRNQSRAENCEDRLSHLNSPIFALVVARRCLARRRYLDIWIKRNDCYASAHHEAASKFLGQKFFRLKNQQPPRRPPDRLGILEPFNEEGASVARQGDQETDICNRFAGIAGCPAGIAGFGADQADAEERNCENRQMRPVRPPCKRHPGLSRQLRQCAGAADTSAAGPGAAGPSSAGSSAASPNSGGRTRA
jgi:hypothetical protein